MTWENGRELKSFTKNGTTTTFKYDINGMRVRKDTGNVITDYYYDDNNVLYGLRYMSTYIMFYYDENGEVSSMLVDGHVFYLFEKNAQGDIIGIINENGERVVSYTYDAWGNPTTTLDANGNDVTNGAWAKAVPFRYRGYIYDTETGLYYLQSRFYDPQTGRFVNADAYTNTETGTPYSANMFAYCENNPVSYVDPNGYWKIKKHRKLSKKFSERTQLWVEYADEKYDSGHDGMWVRLANGDYKLEEDIALSAPFHSRTSALVIAKYLFNKALFVRNSKSKVEFRYVGYEMDDWSDASALYTKYVGFKFNDNSGPDNNNKFKDRTGEVTVKNQKAQYLLQELNNLESFQAQADALLGLALHTLQDYFAHVISITVSSNSKKANSVFKISGGKKLTCTKFSNEYLNNISVFEDKPKVLAWRVKKAKKMTNEIADWWFDEDKVKVKIKEIKFTYSGKEKEEAFKYKKIKYLIKYREGYITVK